MGDDSCPLTRAEHRFRSTWHTDWDGDGCLDSVEDTDDDGDAVLNSYDMCPRTLLSQGVIDSEGCTKEQRDLAMLASSSYTGKVGEMVIEVLIGMVITAVLKFC